MIRLFVLSSITVFLLVGISGCELDQDEPPVPSGFDLDSSEMQELEPLPDFGVPPREKDVDENDDS